MKTQTFKYWYHTSQMVASAPDPNPVGHPQGWNSITEINQSLLCSSQQDTGESCHQLLAQFTKQQTSLSVIS